jgi:hypothetical protein
MRVSLSEAFILFSESSLPLVSCILRGGVTFKLFGYGGEMRTQGPEIMLSGAASLKEMIDNEPEADR